MVSMTVLPENIGPYTIPPVIGRGGMGVVYLAHDTKLERDVALKVLSTDTIADESARKRFRREALALSRLNHPNIETVHDFDTQEGVDFLVMEYIPGVTLNETIAAGALPEKVIARRNWIRAIPTGKTGWVASSVESGRYWKRRGNLSQPSRPTAAASQSENNWRNWIRVTPCGRKTSPNRIANWPISLAKTVMPKAKKNGASNAIKHSNRCASWRCNSNRS